MLKKKYSIKYDLAAELDNPEAKKIKDNCERICEYMIDNLCSIRQCSENIGISKSSVHGLIHTYIKIFYLEEYNQLMKLLKFNQKNRTKPRKNWSNQKPW